MWSMSSASFASSLSSRPRSAPIRSASNSGSGTASKFQSNSEIALTFWEMVVARVVAARVVAARVVVVVLVMMKMAGGVVAEAYERWCTLGFWLFGLVVIFFF